MVKFGRHVQFFVENEHEGSNLYVVPYNDLRLLLSSSDFCLEWRNCLEKASADFNLATRRLWKMIFGGIVEHADSRGALPNEAIRLFVSVSDSTKAQELLDMMKDIHATAVVNSEALRKIVKKFDKAANERGAKHLSQELLPEVYAANFTVGQAKLEACLSLLREELHLEEDESEHENSLWRSSVDDTKRRKGELDWLRAMISSIDSTEIRHIVAHRGFHSPRDRSDRRPLENSLSAYEAAWTNGVHLCECDIALTKDERLVLAHDEDFSRLALDPTSCASNQKVRDLTFKELISLPLKSGSRPPLLIDVLRSAHAIGGDSQLIIEIKPEYSQAAMALARFFFRNPGLIECCAVIMSFDAFAMHEVRRELMRLDDTSESMSLSTSPRKDRKGCRQKPKLLLLTVADPPQESYELWADVGDLSPVDGWLNAHDGSLDGVYLQFQKQMMTPDGAEELRKLAGRYNVGVWGHNGRDPDDYETFHWLVKECQISYVNSDLPKQFKQL